MWLVVLVLLYLAVYKQFEPLLLVPIAFGALLANLPTEGVLNKPAAPLIAPVEGTVCEMFVSRGDSVVVPRIVRQTPTKVADTVKGESTAVADVNAFFEKLSKATSAEGRADVFEKAKGVPDLVAIVRPAKADASAKSYTVGYKGKTFQVRDDDLFVWASTSGTITEVPAKIGSKVVYGETLADVYSHDREQTVSIRLQTGQAKQIKVNSVKKSAGELSQVVNAVLFCPDDLNMIMF